MLHTTLSSVRSVTPSPATPLRQNFCLRPLAALLPLLFAAPLCGAQEAPPTSTADSTAATTLPEVKVTSAQDKEESTPKVMKLQQSLKETPQSVTVVSRKRMEEQNLNTLDDVMQQSTGVTVQPYQLLTTAYYSRGFKIDSFETDGVPVLMANTAAPQQDVFMYERVEIVRGAAGLLHGAGNPAATVNLVPKRPPKTFQANASVAVGSWDHYREEADIGGPLNADGSLRARLVATQDDRNYFYDVGESHSTNVYGISEFDINPDTTLNAGFQTQTIRSVPNMAGVPFYADGTSIGLSRSTYLDVSWDRFDWDTTKVFGGVERQLAHDWKAKFSVNHLEGNADLKYAAAYGAISTTTGTGSKLTGAAYRFDNYQDSADIYATGPFTLLGRQHELLVGANYMKTSVEQFSASLVPALNVAVDVGSWDPSSVAEPATGTYASAGATRTQQSGLYGMGRLSLTDSLKFVLGGRLSRWEQSTSTADYKVNAELTPYGGLIYALSPQWSSYLSYAQIFQPQTYRTWSGAMLDPVRGTNYETGIKGELLDKRLNVSFALFDIRQTNRAYQDPEHACVGSVCYYLASGEVESRGFEIEASGNVTRDLNLTAGYTYNTTQYLEDATSEGKVFAAFVPKNIVRLWGNYTLPWMERRFSTGLGVQAQSRYSVVSGTTTLAQAGYALVNMRVGYVINRNLTAALNVNNLFDRTYYQSLSSTSWSNRYGEPRNLMLTLRATL